MSALNWDPSKSLSGPWGDEPEEFRASGCAKQRRKALRKTTGWRCKHGLLIVGDIDPEQKCSKCAAEMDTYLAREAADY